MPADLVGLRGPDPGGPGLPRPDGTSGLRLFSIWEICRHLIPVAPGHLRRILRTAPGLPAGRTDTEGGTMWFTLEEVFALRDHLARTGRRPQRYLPTRPAVPEARIIGLTPAAPGMGATTLTAHLAIAAAMEGYRVLAIDLDPAGGLTRRLERPSDPDGAAPDLSPAIARHYGTALREDNRRRMERGDAPRPLALEIDRVMDMPLSGLVRPSRWPGLDLLAATSGLHRIAWQVPVWQAGLPGWSAWRALADGLRADDMSGAYDLIFLDTAPDLGPLALMGQAAADLLLLPLTPTAPGAAEAAGGLARLGEAFAEIEARETRIARAVGGAGVEICWSRAHVVLTRHDSRRDATATAALQAALGGALMPQRLPETALLGPGPAGGLASVYDADYRDTNRGTYSEARAPFDELYAAVRDMVLETWDMTPGPAPE